MRANQRDVVRQRKTLFIVLAGLSLALVYSILIGDRGIRRYVALRSSLADRSTETYRRIERNRGLIERLEGLRTDDRVLEEAARSTLGVVSKDEVVFVFRTAPGRPPH